MSSVMTQDDRRTAYRVQPADVDELDLAMLAQRQRLVHGEVTDVSNGGACVRFDKGAPPNLSVGDMVVLSVVSQRRSYAGEMPARIVSATDDPDGQVVHLSFDEQCEKITGKSKDYFELFNRRAQYRGIEHNDAVDLNATIAPDSTDDPAPAAFPVSIRKISNSNVAFDVDEPAHDVLRHHRALILALQFPKEEQASTITCRVRHRTPIAGSYIYGCKYDWSATSDSLAVVENIVNYVLKRLVTDSE